MQEARGVSLWLMPEGEGRRRLEGLVLRLSERLRTVPFAPHVTLLPGLLAPERGVLASARAVAVALAPIPVELAGVDGEESPFRCLFVRAVASPALRDAHARAARGLGREPDPSFDPHLSLVYGVLDAGVKAVLSRELAAETETAFEARRLHVWRTTGPVGEWRELGSFELGAGD